MFVPSGFRHFSLFIKKSAFLGKWSKLGTWLKFGTLPIFILAFIALALAFVPAIHAWWNAKAKVSHVRTLWRSPFAFAALVWRYAKDDKRYKRGYFDEVRNCELVEIVHVSKSVRIRLDVSRNESFHYFLLNYETMRRHNCSPFVIKPSDLLVVRVHVGARNSAFVGRVTHNITFDSITV